MTNAIEIRSLGRAFRRFRALEDVTLTVPTHSICGLLGRNGAGKTTMMSIISGQDRPSSGDVEVLGHAPFEHEATLSNISFIRDNQRYPDNYKLQHVLRIAPDFAPNWNADVAMALVEGLRIPPKTLIKKFSRGQLSAVAIVVGIASRAQVTLLDEPYLGLDVTARALFHDVLLRDYSAHPRTIILSTHLIEESEALFDRVVILEGGRVRVDADRDDIADLAFTISGPATAVDKLAEGRALLRTHAVGALKSVTVEGTVNEELQDRARALGAYLAPVTLQELVAAHGSEATDGASAATLKTDYRKGVRS